MEKLHDDIMEVDESEYEPTTVNSIQLSSIVESTDDNSPSHKHVNEKEEIDYFVQNVLR